MKSIEGHFIAQFPPNKALVLQNDGLVVFGTVSGDGIIPLFEPAPLQDFIAHARKVLSGHPRAITSPIAVMALAAAVMVLDAHLNPFALPIVEGGHGG